MPVQNIVRVSLNQNEPVCSPYYTLLYLLKADGELLLGKQKMRIASFDLIQIPEGLPYMLCSGTIDTMIRFETADFFDAPFFKRVWIDHDKQTAGFGKNLVLAMEENWGYAASDPNRYYVVESIMRCLRNILFYISKSKIPKEVIQLQETIHAQFAAFDFSISETIHKLPFSDNYIRSTFKKVYGRTPTSYLNQIRLFQAKKLLAIRDLPINEVAFQCGFLDTKYFSRLFKKAYHISPSRYRVELLDQKAREHQERH